MNDLNLRPKDEAGRREESQAMQKQAHGPQIKRWVMSMNVIRSVLQTRGARKTLCSVAQDGAIKVGCQVTYSDITAIQAGSLSRT